MNLGLFYQTGYRYVAAYHALNQFRKIYPNAPVAMYEDNTYVMYPIALKFNCKYARTDKQGYNDPNSGRPAYNLETILSWFDRVYEACTTTLATCEYVMNFEDDVWIKRAIKYKPQYDLSGIGGISLNDSIYEYFSVSIRGVYGCGGSVFNRLKYIEAYHKLKNVDWEYIKLLDSKPLEWTDYALTFMFLNAGFTVGFWEDAQQYRNSKALRLDDRSGWDGSISDLELEQGDVSVIHCWKPYYYPTDEEILIVDEELNSIKNNFNVN